MENLYKADIKIKSVRIKKSIGRGIVSKMENLYKVGNNMGIGQQRIIAKKA